LIRKKLEIVMEKINTQAAPNPMELNNVSVHCRADALIDDTSNSARAISQEVDAEPSQGW